MKSLVMKMIEAYYPGENPEELAWNEPDMREVLKVVLEDFRAFASKQIEVEDTGVFVNRNPGKRYIDAVLDAYAKDQKID